MPPARAKAVSGVLGCNAGVVILQGDAGTGKTTCLKEIVAGIEKTGNAAYTASLTPPFVTS